jgi:hypothetical protein
MAKKTQDTSIGPVFQVRDLTAGVNLRPSPTTIQPNQARRLVNALISNSGELGVYPGFVTFSTASLGARRCQGGERVYLSGSTFTLAGDNGNVFLPNDSGVWGSAVLASLSTTEPMDFPYDRDLVAVFDSTNVPKKSVDGSTWTQLGITAPIAPVLSAVAGGALVDGDTYEVSYAYGDSTLSHYSNATAIDTQACAGANLTVRCPVIASADTTVDKIQVFARDVTAGETVRRLFGTYTNTSANIDIDSNNWDAQIEAYSDHDVSVAMSFGIVWKNRWWGRDATTKNRLRFSQIFQNQSWPSTFYVDIPFARGEYITAMIALGDVLVVFGYTTFYLIIGQTSLDFEVRPSMGGQTGAFGLRSVDIIENGIVHAGVSGVYLFNGSSDELLSYGIDPAWREMVGGSASSELALLPLTYHKFVKELRVGVPILYPTGTRGEWILDLNRTNNPAAANEASTGPAWFSTDRTIGGYIQWDGNETTAGDQGRIFSWSPTIATLFEERTGDNADGASRIMEYDGYMLPFGLQSARVIDSYLEYRPAGGTLTLDLNVDGKLMGAQTFSLETALSVYGTAIYGTATYSGGRDRATMPVMWPLEAEGRAVQLLVKFSGVGDFKLFTYGFNTFADGLPRGL